MDESPYPDSDPDEKASEGSPDKPEAKDKDKEDHKDEPTELVSKKFLGLDEDEKAEPGHKCTLEVVHDFGDEVEVRYVKHKKKKDSDDSDDDSEKMSADDELDSIESSTMMKG